MGYDTLKMEAADTATQTAITGNTAPSQADEQKATADAVHGMINLLVSNKGSAEPFQFFKNNKEKLDKLADFFGQNSDGLIRALEMNATTDLASKFPDQRSKDAWNFLVQNRKEVASIIETFRGEPTFPYVPHFNSFATATHMKSSIQFVAKHADELASLSKFAAEHSDDLRKIADLGLQANASHNTYDYVKLNKSLLFFKLQHPTEAGKIKDLIEHQHSELGSTNLKQPPNPQELISFFLKNKEELSSLQSGIEGINKGLGRTIYEKQREATGKVNLEAARKAMHELPAAYENLKKFSPDLYNDVVALQRTSIALFRERSNPRSTIDTMQSWFDAEQTFYEKVNKPYLPKHQSINAVYISSIVQAPILLKENPYLTDAIEKILPPATNDSKQAPPSQGGKKVNPAVAKPPPPSSPPPAM